MMTMKNEITVKIGWELESGKIEESWLNPSNILMCLNGYTNKCASFEVEKILPLPEQLTVDALYIDDPDDNPRFAKSQKVEEKDNACPVMDGRQAINGFWVWLSNRKEKTVMGGDAGCANIPELIEEFCHINSLPDGNINRFALEVKYPEPSSQEQMTTENLSFAKP